MLQDPNVERYVEIAIKPLVKEIAKLKLQIEELNKALREQLFCSMVGKGFCPYESKDGKCTMLDKCVNHTTK